MIWRIRERGARSGVPLRLINARQRSREFDRSITLSPLVILAACGGGRTEPVPAPPSGGAPTPTPTPTPPAQPDTVSPPVGDTTASGNVLANDVAGTIVGAIALEGGAAASVGQPLQGRLGRITIQSDGAFSYAIGNDSSAFTA